MPECPHCDKEVAYDAEFCPRCGKRDPGFQSFNASTGRTTALGTLIFHVIVGAIAGFVAPFFVCIVYNQDSGRGNPIGSLGLLLAGAAVGGVIAAVVALKEVGIRSVLDDFVAFLKATGIVVMWCLLLIVSFIILFGLLPAFYAWLSTR